MRTGLKKTFSILAGILFAALIAVTVMPGKAFAANPMAAHGKCLNTIYDHYYVTGDPYRVKTGDDLVPGLKCHFDGTSWEVVGNYYEGSADAESAPSVGQFLEQKPEIGKIYAFTDKLLMPCEKDGGSGDTPAASTLSGHGDCGHTEKTHFLITGNMYWNKSIGDWRYPCNSYKFWNGSWELSMSYPDGGYLGGMCFGDPEDPPYIVGGLYYLNDNIYSDPDERLPELTLCGVIPWGSESTSSSSEACAHRYEYQTIEEPTEEKDGKAGSVCTLCGDVSETYVISRAEAVIQNKYAQIDKAQPGQTVTLNMGAWHSLSRAFMAKIASKNDVNFLIDFTYNNKNYEVSIPAGTKVDTTSADWYGPDFLMSLYPSAER